MKKPAYIILALALIALLIVVTIQNSRAVFVNFIAWEFSASLILVIFVSFLAGALTSLLLMLPSMLRTKKANRKKQDIPEDT